MLKKLGELLSSRRFWQLVVATIILVLGSYQIIPKDVAEIVAGLFGVSVTVGTIDRFKK
jgi:hypothetical protein